jgi:RNA polymerase sigma-70 factor (ECF subfamily)
MRIASEIAAGSRTHAAYTRTTTARPLARRVVAPERAAFERIVMPLLSGLRSSALHLTKNRPDADDLVQETLLRAWRFWSGYEERDNCRAWLQRILVNTFCSEHRRRQRQRAQLSLFEVEQQLSAPRNEPSPDARSDAQRSHALDEGLQNGLATLSTAQQRVLSLIDLQERSYREAAAELACPIGTVMSRLHRARAALRLQLRPLAHA